MEERVTIRIHSYLSLISNAIANCYSLSICRQECQRYYTNRQLAIESSDEYLSIILDGMYKNKTNVPHLVPVPKSCQNLWCLGVHTHLTGGVVHRVGNFGYFDFIQWPHLTITTLLFTLANIAQNGYLPHRLLLQIDNCVHENKINMLLDSLKIFMRQLDNGRGGVIIIILYIVEHHYTLYNSTLNAQAFISVIL